MRIMISVEHPAWAHQFRYVIRELEKKGHTIKVVAINKDHDLELLDSFGIPYQVISNSSGKGLLQKGIIFLWTTFRIWQISRTFKPDMYAGRPSPMMAINSFIFGKEHIVFEDTEHGRLCQFIAKRFSSTIITPACFKKDLGSKHVRVETYKETFYLHPDRFAPDSRIIEQLGLGPDDRFTLLRFVAWDAHHDFGRHGLSVEAKQRLVQALKAFGKVLVSSEGPLPPELEQYRITVPQQSIHDLLYYASLYLGEGTTMATEAAVLGTPTIVVSSLAQYCGNFDELQAKYRLLFAYSDVREATAKAIELLKDSEVKREWQRRSRQMMTEKLDGTKYMTDLIDKRIGAPTP